jgi:ribosomal protein L15
MYDGHSGTASKRCQRFQFFGIKDKFSIQEYAGKVGNKIPSTFSKISTAFINVSSLNEYKGILIARQVQCCPLVR